MTSQKCTLCTRMSASEKGYCKKHLRAYTQILSKFPNWKIAYEEISWERYLETINRLYETGDLAKAVAIAELRQMKA